MRRMQSKKYGSHESNHPVPRELLRQAKNQPRRYNVTQNASRVPTHRPVAKQNIVQPQPQKKQRTVIVSGAMRINRSPHMRRPVLRQVTPTLDGWIFQYLGDIVIDEFESQRTKINQSAYNAGECLQYSRTHSCRKKQRLTNRSSALIFMRRIDIHRADSWRFDI